MNDKAVEAANYIKGQGISTSAEFWALPTDKKKDIYKALKFIPYAALKADNTSDLWKVRLHQIRVFAKLKRRNVGPSKKKKQVARTRSRYGSGYRRYRRRVR